jgi:chemotaxis protein MotB
MNLLLILFIVLFAMSQIDVAKFNKLASSFREEFGDSTSASLMGDGATGNSLLEEDYNAPSSVLPSKAEEQQFKNVKETVTKLINKENLQGTVDVSMQERGIEISIEEQVLFDPGSAEIKPAARQSIIKIGKVLLQVPGKHIRIEGHTDSDPIHTLLYSDNLDLSNGRASSVFRILKNQVGLNPKMMSSTGFGEWQPKVPNTTAANKAKNRRVDIVILKEMYNSAETGDSDKSTSDNKTGTTQNTATNKTKGN